MDAQALLLIGLALFAFLRKETGIVAPPAKGAPTDNRGSIAPAGAIGAVTVSQNLSAYNREYMYRRGGLLR